VSKYLTDSILDYQINCIKIEPYNMQIAPLSALIRAHIQSSLYTAP